MNLEEDCDTSMDIDIDLQQGELPNIVIGNNKPFLILCLSIQLDFHPLLTALIQEG